MKTIQLLLLALLPCLAPACEDDIFGGPLYRPNLELRKTLDPKAWIKQIIENDWTVSEHMDEQESATAKVIAFIDYPAEFPHSLRPLLDIESREKVLALLQELANDSMTYEEWQKSKSENDYDQAARWGQKLRALEYLGLFCGPGPQAFLLEIAGNAGRHSAVRQEAASAVSQREGEKAKKEIAERLAWKQELEEGE